MDPKKSLTQEIIYRISHDLGAPLRHINNFSSLLSSDYNNELTEEAQEWLHYVQSSAQKAQTMLDSLLQYSRIFTSKQPITTINLQQIWQNTISEYQVVIKEKNAKIKTKPLPIIHAIQQHWYLLFSELLKNSLLYQPIDQQPDIRLSCQELEKNFVLQLDDNGIGVDEKYHDELTTIFRRLHTEEDYPGVGMGLALCARVLEYYNGTIEFHRSNLGGLTVKCIIPKI